MTAPNRNLLWSHVILDELRRGGVRHVCLSPGSRSAPLAFALHEEPRLRTTVHLDERSGGFAALGLAKATGRPVALVCTSGTAVANYMPAVVEASQSGVPLVVVTADRPAELRGTGANQTIHQERFFGDYARFFIDAGLPDLPKLRDLRAGVARLVAHARGTPAGPVHLNVPFREPLEPTVVPGDVPQDLDREGVEGRARDAPFVDERLEAPLPDPRVLERVTPWLSKARGLLVAGPEMVAGDGPAVVELAAATGWPLVADPLSGARFVPGSKAIASYDAFLGHATTRSRLVPDVVFRFGGTPVSKNLLSFLEGLRDVPQVTVNPMGRYWGPAAASHVGLATGVATAVQALVARVEAKGGDAAWSDTWRRLDHVTRKTHESATSSREFEGALAAHAASNLPSGSVFFVSSSLPIRDVDRFVAGPEPAVRVLANRGASGIDGVVSSALGAALSGTPTTLLIGDVAFLHDLSGVLSAARLGVPLSIIVVNNGGGGIFEFLPAAKHGQAFEELLATPHRHDVAALAKAAGFEVTTSARAGDVAAWMGQPVRGPRLFEYAGDRKANARERKAVEVLVHEGLERAWAVMPGAR